MSELFMVNGPIDEVRALSGEPGTELFRSPFLDLGGGIVQACAFADDDAALERILANQDLTPIPSVPRDAPEQQRQAKLSLYKNSARPKIDRRYEILQASGFDVRYRAAASDSGQRPLALPDAWTCRPVLIWRTVTARSRAADPHAARRKLLSNPPSRSSHRTWVAAADSASGGASAMPSGRLSSDWCGRSFR